MSNIYTAIKFIVRSKTNYWNVLYECM